MTIRKSYEPAFMKGGLDMSANPWYFFTFMVVINLPGILVGYALGYQNQVTKCFYAKFDWTTNHEQKFHDGFLASSVTLGMCLGAVTGGRVMKFGRRKALFLVLLLASLGVIVQCNLYFSTLMIGRFIYGFAVGIASTVCPRYIEETVPQHIYPSVGVTFALS